MKEKYIEFTKVVFDVVKNLPSNFVTAHLRSGLNLPDDYRGRIQLIHNNWKKGDDFRFPPHSNIRPDSLRDASNTILQAILLDRKEFPDSPPLEWFGWQFGAIAPSDNVKDLALEMLDFAQRHDAWNHEHFWNEDGKYVNRIFFNVTNLISFLDRNHIKHSIKTLTMDPEPVEEKQTTTIEQSQLVGYKEILDKKRWSRGTLKSRLNILNIESIKKGRKKFITKEDNARLMTEGREKYQR